MKWCIVLLLAVLSHSGRDFAFAKPGFDFELSVSLNSLRYRNELHQKYHLDNGMKFVEKQKLKTSTVNLNVAKNAILFLGDGMSVPTLAATRIYMGGEEKSLSFEEFPYLAMSKTYCVDNQVPDSACTTTGNHFHLFVLRSTFALFQHQSMSFLDSFETTQIVDCCCCFFFFSYFQRI